MDKSAVIVCEDIFIDVPWGHIAGRWYGNRNVRPILALHGWQDNLGTWDRLIPLLPQQIAILCIDFPGHGRSSKYPIGATYHVIDYVQVIVRIVKEYKWQKISLMGHSMGAICAFVYACLYPHTIDILIQIDLVKPVYHSLTKQIEKIQLQGERSLIENERMEQSGLKEPPSYLYHELEDLLHKGSGKSVERENCKYLLHRSIEKSQLYPDKYYFSRDGRTKYCVEFSGDYDLSLEMAKRIKNIAYTLIKSDMLSYMTKKDEQIVDVLRANNRNFEYHIIYNSTHHLHLNNAEEVAALINPFILKYRPLELPTCTEENNVRNVDKQKRQTSKL